MHNSVFTLSLVDLRLLGVDVNRESIEIVV